MNKKALKFKIALGIVLTVLTISLLSGGSDVIKNYTPPEGGASVQEEEEKIEYNYDVLNQVTGGYSGPPKLVASDDRVFYIPPEYCDGEYLKNFRVIGINQSNAKITKDAKGNITDYSGAVILYGFQTTYRADYGANYDFDYEPYDYDVEYEVVDDYFNNVVLGKGEKTDTEDSTETTTAAEDNIRLKVKENKKTVNDSDFKVATVVMEHEIGKDECKILYCDADACTVADLDVGKYNLVTNLNDSALTVCHNEKILVYSYNENAKSYGSNEVYYYKLQDLFNSITFKNTLADIGYCRVAYDVTGDISYSNTSAGWVDTWLSKMTTRKKNSVPNAKYLSNLHGSTADKNRINSEFINMEDFVKNQVESAYSGYKKTSSGWLSYKHSTGIEDFSNYTYQATGKNQWQLTNTFKFKVQETSWIVLAPKTYKGSADGTITINISPDFTLLTDYTYSINDMLLTRYGSDKSGNKYSLVVQMMVTPTSKIEEEDKMEPIEDFDQYAKDVNSRTEDSTPDGVDESELEEKDKKAEEDDEEQEEHIEKEISSKYITLNINLAQKSGTQTAEDIEVLSISNTAEIDSYFKQLKKNYQKEYDDNIAAFDKEEKTGAYVVPKQYTLDSLNDFKAQFKDIKECCEQIDKTQQELDELISKRDELQLTVEQNAADTNALADKLTGDFAISDKTIDEDTGYYKQLYETLAWSEEPKTITSNEIFSLVKDYVSFVYGSATDNKSYLTNTTYAEQELKYIAGQYKVSYPIIQYSKNVSVINKQWRLFKQVLYSKTDNANEANVLYHTLKIQLNPLIRNKSMEIAIVSFMSGADNGKLCLDINDTKSISAFSGIDISTLEHMNNYMSDIYAQIGTPGIGISSYYKTQEEKIDYLKRINSNFASFYNQYTSINNRISTMLYSAKTMKNAGDYCATEAGGQIIANLAARSNYIKTLNDYDVNLIPAKQAELQALKDKLVQLKNKYTDTSFYIDLKWEGKAVTADFLADNYKLYDDIIKNADEYITAYTSLVDVDPYRSSADKVIDNIKYLNSDESVNRILENMYIALLNSPTREKYGTNYDSLVYLYEHRNRFYCDLTSSINYHAGIKSAQTEQVTQEQADKDNVNKNLIESSVKSHYAAMGANAVKKLTYSAVIKDCENIYNSLLNKFEKVVIQQDGEDKEICDVSVEDVQNAVYTLLLDEYGITELSDYNADGTPSKTYTIAKGQSSQGNVYENTESTTESTTEAVDTNVLKAVYAGYSKLYSYTGTLKGHYDCINDIANDRLLGNGSLNDEQQSAIKVEDENVDKDITSDYNTGYKAALDICDDMTRLLDEAKTYYEQREKAAGEIKSAQTKGLSVALRDDRYYVDTYKQKCYEADTINRLVYNAAKAKNAGERQTYVDEYNNTDWLIKDDINIDKDLSSAIVIKRKSIKTSYQIVDWNTSLIKGDVMSNASSTPYELYQMNSNFCLGVSGNDAFIVPMGTQADVNVTALNNKIADEIKNSGIEELENVAYGSNNGYDLLLFSGNNKWFMIAYKQVNKKITVDTKNVVGYSGTYNVSDEDVHFLEYDHTRLTGVNQLFTTTLENGYQPYKITLKTSRNGTIEKEVTKENDKVGIGMSGSFYNSWSDEKGNVILLGYKSEDMIIAEEKAEGSTEVITYYEGNTETTTEVQTREVNENDIYEAHLYVLQYDVKKAEGETPEDYKSFFDTSTGSLYDADIRLEGPFGELLEAPVNLLTVALKSVFAIVYALALLYCVHLGVKMSKASDTQERDKAKKHIMWFLIAFIGTHILIVFLYLAKTQLEQWSYDVTTAAVHTDIMDTKKQL